MVIRDGTTREDGLFFGGGILGCQPIGKARASVVRIIAQIKVWRVSVLLGSSSD